MFQFRGFPFIFISCIFLSACSVELRDKATKQDQEAKPSSPSVVTRPEKGIPEADLVHQLQIPMKGPNYEIFEGNGFNSYQVHINPPSEAKAIERTNVQTLEKSRHWLPKSEWVDQDVVAGAIYQYRFLNPTGEVLGQTLVNVPLDLVMSGPISANSLKLDRPLRRLVFSANTVLKLGSQSIELKAESIWIEPGARIETFPVGSKAPSANAVAASGGQLTMMALSAQGHLVAEMRGVDGGDGKVGQAYQEPAAAGASFPETITSRGQCENLKKGGDGQKGLAGRPGEDGGAGGNTGSLILNVLNDQDLQVDVRWSPGKGGQAGSGGPGQRGGLAGVSEVRKIVSRPIGVDAGMENESICPPIPDGQAGEDGPVGLSGVVGHDGVQGIFCRRSQQQSCQ